MSGVENEATSSVDQGARELPLSERRIQGAREAVLEQVEKAYETVFPRSIPDDRFFEDFAFALQRFNDRVKKRPISPREVQVSQTAFRNECRKAMMDARERARKPDSASRSAPASQGPGDAVEGAQ